MANDVEITEMDSMLGQVNLSSTSENEMNRNNSTGPDSNANQITERDDLTLQSWGFPLKQLYHLALKFYKEKEGKAIHLSYSDKLKLVALTSQVSHGKFNPDTLPPLGVLDVIGRDRRTAWQELGNINKQEAMLAFVELLAKICPLFKATVEATKRDIEERERLAKEIVEKQKEEEQIKRIEEEQKKKEEEDRLKQETQKRQIQDALNQQTFYQFKAYAEQQFPGNPEQQGVLIRQLQEHHYHQYMQQLCQQQRPNEEVAQLLANGEATTLADDTDEEGSQGESGGMSAASMWTRKDIKEFKESIRKEGGDAIIKVGHGETVTVRVPTHEDGTCLFWEFATDSYDIGFGVYFEWTKPESSQVSVHISESEDEDDDDDEEDDDDDLSGVTAEDIERGATASGKVSRLASELAATRPPLSIIVPVYRRDCQEEVYAGSHVYPGQGVYLLKFDNSYSLWRSKTLYYRVYYTR